MISQLRNAWRSLAGGELSEEMFGRVDLPRNAIGMKRCYNAIVTPQGAVENRAGSRFITTTNDNQPAWLVPFVRSDGQGFLLEFGDQTLRVISSNGVVSTPEDTVPDVDVFTISSVSIVTESFPSYVVFGITVPAYTTATVTITTTAPHGFVVDDDVVLSDLALVNPDAAGNSALQALLSMNHDITGVPTTSSFVLGPIYYVTASLDGWALLAASPYNGLFTGGEVTLVGNSPPTVITPVYSYAHIRLASFAQFVDDLVIAHKLYPTAKVTRVDDTTWTYTALTFNATLAAPAGVAATPFGTPGADPITYTYTVTATNDEGAESATATPDTAANTLRTLGNYNAISWSTVATTFRYNVYKGIGVDSVYGYIGSATGLTFTDDNISPDFTKQPAEIIAAFDSADNYPGTVCFLEQRMILAATLAEPQAFWASGLAAFDYFKASVPPQDDQAFTYELSSLQATPIRHALALHELLFFTGSGVQRIASVTGELFGPTTIAARNVVAIGAHEQAKPQEAGTTILFPGARGGHLQQLTPEDSIAGYAVDDLSVIAAHLIDQKDWVQTGFRRAPTPMWFGLRNDGLLIGLTYMPEQKVFAWHQHELPGAVIESFAVVPESNEDKVYVVAKRTINGTVVRYIERIESRLFSSQVEAYFVDSGVTYRGVATTTITGLDHLEGESVIALADGRVVGPFTVFAGEIELDVEASIVHVGLSYTTQIETVPLAYADQAGFGVGIMKNVSQVWLRLKQSLGMTAGPSFAAEDQQELKPVETELIGDTPALRDGVQDIDVAPTWTVDSTVCIQQTQPLPLTLTGLAIDFVDG